MSQNEFYDRELNCPIKQQGNCIKAQGRDIVKNFGLDSPDLISVTFINIGMTVLFCIIGMIGFHITTKPILKLQSQYKEKKE